MTRNLSALLLAFGIFAMALSAPGTQNIAVAQSTRLDLVQDAPVPGATNSAEATASGEASPSAQVSQKIEEKKEKDITESSGPAKGRLAQLLDSNPIAPLNPTNFLQHAIRRAVDQGVQANVLVLILLFPVIASFIAASRHIIGLAGFGVYAPAILAVALLSTGIITGLFLFISILLVASVGRSVIKRFKLQYLPRTALLLWVVALSVFGLLLASPYFLRINLDLITLNIFPILVLVLLSENFVEATQTGSESKAIELTLETILLAVISALFVRTKLVQDFVILHPELTILAVLVIDMAVGKYSGLRLTEYFRFKPILDPEEE